MRLLILGGTVFLGRHVVEAARGHDITIYTRGLHGTAPEGVEHVIGDRADLSPLGDRTWDAVIDTSGYTPEQVAPATKLAGHYVFVSSCNAYPDWPDKPVDEDSPTWTEGEGYGPEKAAAERHVLAAGGAVVRAGLIVGPHDNVFRLPWWVRRIAEGGEVPAPGDPGRELQIIDARDLADWLVRLAEDRVAGAFNGTGPIGQTTMGELLETAVSVTGSDATLRWIPEDRLEDVEPWTELPLWLPARHLGTWRVGTERAQAAGLTTRPVAETVRDTWNWLQSGGESELDDWRAEHRPPRMSAEREAALIRLLC